MLFRCQYMTLRPIKKKKIRFIAKIANSLNGKFVERTRPMLAERVNEYANI